MAPPQLPSEEKMMPISNHYGRDDLNIITINNNNITSSSNSNNDHDETRRTLAMQQDGKKKSEVLVRESADTEKGGDAVVTMMEEGAEPQKLVGGMDGKKEEGVDRKDKDSSSTKKEVVHGKVLGWEVTPSLVKRSAGLTVVAAAVTAVTLWMICYCVIVNNCDAPVIKIHNIKLEKTWFTDGGKKLNAQVLFQSRVVNKESRDVKVVMQSAHAKKHFLLNMYYYPDGIIENHEGTSIAETVVQDMTVHAKRSLLVDKSLVLEDITRYPNGAGTRLAGEALGNKQSTFHLVGIVPLKVKATPFVWVPTRLLVDCRFTHQWGMDVNGKDQVTSTEQNTVCHNTLKEWWW